MNPVHKEKRFDGVSLPVTYGEKKREEEERGGGGVWWPIQNKNKNMGKSKAGLPREQVLEPVLPSNIPSVCARPEEEDGKKLHCAEASKLSCVCTAVTRGCIVILVNTATCFKGYRGEGAPRPF